MRKSCFKHISDSIFCPERCDIRRRETTAARGLQKALRRSDGWPWTNEQSLAHEFLIGDKDQRECDGHHDL